MTILAICAILFTSLYLIIQSRKGDIDIDPKLEEITIISIILLAIYALFEGFVSENPVFITLRAVSLALFIIVPTFFILVNRVGLQKLLIIQEGGIPLLSYNFSLGQFLSFDTSEGHDFILVAGFLSAISSFSGGYMKGGSGFSIKSDRFYFIISQIDGTIYALQTLHVLKNLEDDFYEFATTIHPQIKSVDNSEDLDKETMIKTIRESFLRYA